MRQITDHHDGNGLNDAIAIESDERDPNAGNGSHAYFAVLDAETVARIQFQHGPRHVEGSTPGMTSTALLAVLIDHIQGFQGGPYACRENAIALTHLETAMLWMRKRADDRARRGVLGKNEK